MLYQLGDSGAAAERINQVLFVAGNLDSVDDQYDEATVQAVKYFQLDHGLRDDGLVGPLTWGVLFPPGKTAALPPTAETTDPVWLAWALSKLGLKEAPGSVDNQEILTWMDLIPGFPRSMRHDATPWCAIFANASLELNGIRGPRSAAAIDFLSWGKKVAVPYRGCAAVFKRLNEDGEVIGHHVAFYLDEDEEDVFILGGNQADKISKIWHSKRMLLGYTAPVGYRAPA